MNKIPTAEEYFESKVFNKTKEQIQRIMIEFAKLHAQAQLEAIVIRLCPDEELRGRMLWELQNAYPLTKIK
jgi:hypothetical protein